MGIIQLFFIGLGLSMDAFAVSICQGLKMKRLDFKQTVIIALFFGGFQGIMPFIGWLIGKNFETYITSFDHWIAFALLVIIGGKMIIESFESNDSCEVTSSLKDLILLAVATSIDALAVGITFAFLKMSILLPVLLIGIITFVFCIFGVIIGNKFGSHYKNKAEFLGGIILILIGLKILLEHLNII